MEEKEAWEPVQDQLFAVGTHSFKPNIDEDFPDQVPMSIGDVIEVLETCGTWYRGFLFVPSNIGAEPRLGVVPANHTRVIKSLPSLAKNVKINRRTRKLIAKSERSSDSEASENESTSHLEPVDLPDPSFPIYQSPVASDEPLVGDVHWALCDWNLELKNLLIEQNYKQYALIKKELYFLLKGRRQLVGHSVSEEGMENIRQDLIHRINRGNHMLGLDLILLNSIKGPVDPDDRASVIRMFRDFATLSDSVSKNSGQPGAGHAGRSSSSSRTLQTLGMESGAPASSSVSKFSACILFDLKSSKGPFTTADNPLELHFSFWQKSGPRPITEAFVIERDSKGSDLNMGSRAVFADISMTLINTETYLVVQVFEQGPVGEWGMSKTGPDAVTVRKPYAVGCLSTQDLLQGKETQPTSGFPIRLVATPTPQNFSSFHETLFSKIQPDTKDTLFVGIRAQPYDWRDYLEVQPQWKDATVVQRCCYPDFVPREDRRNSVFITMVSGSFSRSSGRNIEVTLQMVGNDGSVIPNCVWFGCRRMYTSSYSGFVVYHCSAPVWKESVRVDLDLQKTANAAVLFLFRHCSSGEKVSKPFGFSFLPVRASTGTVVSGDNELVVYKVEKSGSLPKNFLKLPFLARSIKRDGSAEQMIYGSDGTTKVLALKDQFTSSIELSSTVLTQNQPLMNLFNWKAALELPYNDLPSTLRDLKYVDNVEMLKFLHRGMDALFGILMSKLNGEGQLTEAILGNIISFLSLPSDRRLSEAEKHVENYISNICKCENVWPQLLLYLREKSVPSKEKAPTQNQKLVIKLWNHLFALVIRSRQVQEINEIAKNGVANSTRQEDFRSSLEVVFKDINSMMSQSDPDLLALQMLALQSFNSVLSHLNYVFKPKELVPILESFIDAMPENSSVLVEQKMLFMLNVVKGPLYENAESRVSLAKALSRWLRQHTTSFSSGGNSKRQVLRISTIVLAEMLDRQQLFLVDSKRDSKNPEHEALDTEMQRIFCDLLPISLEHFQDAAEFGDDGRNRAASQTQSFSHTISSIHIQSVASATASMIQRVSATSVSNTISSNLNAVLGVDEQAMTDINTILALSGACFMAQMHMISTELLVDFLNGLHSSSAQAMRVVLIQMFEVSRLILEGEAFPISWSNMHVFACKVLLRGYQGIYSFLKEKAAPVRAEDFDTYLWCTFFRAVISLTMAFGRHTQSASGQTRRLALMVGGRYDIFREAMDLLTSAWDVCGQSSDGTPLIQCQLKTIPLLVSDVLALTLFEHSNVRQTACDLIFSMIQTEYAFCKSIKRIEQESVEKMDHILAARGVSRSEKDAFYTSFMSVIERNCKDTALHGLASKFADVLAEFLSLTWTVVSLPIDDQYEDDRWEALIDLAKFMRKNGREATYIRYIHNLADQQMKNRNLVEAGFTLKMHADVLSWNPDVMLDPDADCGFDSPQSEFSRKEELYLSILSKFEEGGQWEPAIELCKELAHEYEFQLIQYDRLASVLQRQAMLYQKILTKKRYYSEYFRVGFYGCGFPVPLRNKQFIYRGEEWEKIGPFCERIQTRHPDAKLLKTNTPPDVSITKDDGRYLQITRVEPEPDLSQPVLQRPVDTVPDNIRQYYLSNNFSVFTFSRPIKKEAKNKDNEFLSLWTEKTMYYTEDQFPHMLRRSRVVRTEIIELSPIENALDTIIKKTGELSGLEVKFLKHTEENCNPLTMSLNGAIDAPVNGGINMYKRSFLEPSYSEEHAEHRELVKSLRDAIDEQVIVMKRCLDLHERIVPETMRPLHDNLVNLFFKNYAEEAERLHIGLVKRTRKASLEAGIERKAGPTIVSPSSNPSSLSNALHASLNSSHFGSPFGHLLPRSFRGESKEGSDGEESWFRLRGSSLIPKHRKRTQN